MNTRQLTHRRILPLALVGLLALGLGACSDDAASSTTTGGAAGGAQVVGPVIAEMASLDGSTVQVSLTRLLVINADAPATWSATVADPSVLTFEPGKSEGGAEFNPGFTPLKVGTTEVTMTDGTTTATFTVEVTE